MGGEEGSGVTTGQPNLCKQDLSKLDVNKLTALSPEVISRQATINIGTIGHVAHGKSTIVKAISTVHTVRFKNELERNITIKLDTFAAENCGVTNPLIRGITGDDNSSSLISSPCSSRSSTPSSNDSCKSSDCSSIRFEDSLQIETLTDLYQNDKELVLSQQKCKLKTSLEQQIQLKSLRVVLKDFKHEPEVMSQTRKRSRTFEKTHKEQSKRPRNNSYEVEKILSKKTEFGKDLFLVKWKGWAEQHNTWEPREHLNNCPDILRMFENQNSKMIEKFQTATNWKPTRSDVESHMRQLIESGSGCELKVDLEQTEKMISNYFRRRVTDRTDASQKKIQQVILALQLREARRQQLYNLQDWEKEMNNISKGKPKIRVENQVDLEMAPQIFVYIDDYLPGKGVMIPDEPPIGCYCKDCGASESKDKCCFSEKGEKNKLSYTMQGKIRVPWGTPIYECNKRCSCGPSCCNRVVQKGACVKLCVFRTTNGTGWGVKTLKKIKKGSFVIQYVGEVITFSEAEERGKRYDAAGRTYLFDLDFNDREQFPFTVDAAVYGNVSHFINHSCEPNLLVYPVWINCLDPNLPKLALFAKRDIEEEEEITFDYMCQKEQDVGNQTIGANDSRPRLELGDDDENLQNRTRCKCGSESCRKYIF